MNLSFSQNDSGQEYKSKLLGAVKKEVKQIMEEAVTKKFVHEESGSVTSLCAAVEACLSQGLRRRALGLFKTSSTTALLHKVAKHCPEAAIISQRVQECENADPNRRSSSSGDSISKPTLKKGGSLQNLGISGVKYLWIRLALFDKHLAKIIDHLVTHANRYYDKDALVADPDYGSILSSLLVGPCALDFSRTKTPDHFWTDPPADELVQRHRISSGHATPPSVRRPILNFINRSSLRASSEDSISSRSASTQHVAKDYVESLHQNSRATLLYGKNNVLVMPVGSEVSEPMPGYLSLHQGPGTLTIKWTPNQLMNGFVDHEVQDKRRGSLPVMPLQNRPPLVLRRKSCQSKLPIYWDYALQVRLDEIVYVHCHQDGDTGGTVILVGQDGVQRPPIHFPKGGHMLSFLSCLETGLLPHGRLDPPLWSQRGPGGSGPSAHGSGRPRRRPLPALQSPQPTSTDYVFRIVDNSYTQDILKRHDLLEKQVPQTRVRIQLASTSTSSESSTKSFSLDQSNNSLQISTSPPNICIQQVCDSMKRQIISRAFYGWLAYCRHLSTVRTHLSGLVMAKIINGDGANEGLTVKKWEEIKSNGFTIDSSEIYKLTYFGGVAHEIRKEVWPYLLGHYKFGSSENERTELYEQTRQAYENTMSEWLAVEAIVRQRDKENTAASIAKLSSESTSGENPPPTATLPRDLSNDVFEDELSDEDSPCASPDSSQKESRHSVIITNPSVDMSGLTGNDTGNHKPPELGALEEGEENSLDTLGCNEIHGTASPNRSACVSPASSNGGVYSAELLETFGLNLHRIDKDVQRCDRNYWYFAGDNLDKLRNVMCTYVWEHLDIGYMQGMCDLVAPLLVILDDESETYACFCHLMERMVDNFPNGGAMDAHFANMRSLIQILDSEMYELMHSQGDYTHFYFCYRWFLLDFKRELLYNDVFAVWEVIWAAQHVASSHFVLFLALALLETYRDIILSNNMDFTDIIKFFNEMAERHDAQATLALARDLVLQLQLLIENK